MNLQSNNMICLFHAVFNIDNNFFLKQNVTPLLEMDNGQTPFNAYCKLSETLSHSIITDNPKVSRIHN